VLGALRIDFARSTKRNRSRRIATALPNAYRGEVDSFAAREDGSLRISSGEGEVVRRLVYDDSAVGTVTEFVGILEGVDVDPILDIGDCPSNTD